jgi:hypothetical protein
VKKVKADSESDKTWEEGTVTIEMQYPSTLYEPVLSVPKGEAEIFTNELISESELVATCKVEEPKPSSSSFGEVPDSIFDESFWTPQARMKFQAIWRDYRPADYLDSAWPIKGCGCSSCEAKRKTIIESFFSGPADQSKEILDIPEEVEAEWSSLPVVNTFCSHCGTHFEPVKSYSRPGMVPGLSLCLRCTMHKYTCVYCHKEMLAKDAWNTATCSPQCYIKSRQPVETMAIPTSKDDNEPIDISVALASEAADFYLLLEASTRCPEAKAEANKLAKKLADQFSRYMFMAIGGELRHFLWSENAGIVYDAIRECFRVQEIEEMEAIFDWFKQHTREFLSRNESWDKWSNWRETIAKIYPVSKLDLLDFAQYIFEVSAGWQFGCGGRPWATITNTLKMYLTGGLTDVMFVDTAFGLKHNHQLHFDKIWCVELLEFVLNLNANGDYDTMKIIANKETVEYVETLREK